MSTISASQVKELRDRTGAGMMQCKQALSEAKGDMDAAIKWLREKGMADAVKRSGKATNEGLIVAMVSDDHKKASIIQLNCETDFVARNEDFQALANEIVEDYLKTDEVWQVDQLPETIDKKIKEKIATIRENINLTAVGKLKVDGTGYIQSYIHGGGTNGVIVSFLMDKQETANEEEFQQLAKDIAMHITAMAPVAVDEDKVPTEVIEQEKDIQRKIAKESGKPDDIIEKMIVGRIKKFLKDIVLLDQVFVKDNNLTIAKLLAEKSKQLGDKITVCNFIRFKLGE